MNDQGKDCLVSVDGTDFETPLQQLNLDGFYSHKHNGPGLRYEVAICINTGSIVWTCGPFPCGDWPDVSIFRYGLKSVLDPNERVEADDGYIGEDPATAKVPGSMVHDQDDRQLYVRSKVRLRHESVDKRLKQFNCLKRVSTNSIEFHGACFRACAVLTQMSMDKGHPAFYVPEYSESST